MAFDLQTSVSPLEDAAIKQLKNEDKSCLSFSPTQS